MKLTLQNIAPVREGRLLTNKINLSLLPGACIIFTGRNGIGKSTLLKTIASVIPPDKNTILCNEIDVTDVYDEYREILCYIGNNTTLDQDLSVQDNLLFWAKLSDREELLSAAIFFWELEEYIDHKIKDLSAGFQRRVQLCCLLFSNAPLWILDEPFNNLDLIASQKLQNLINSKCQNGGIICIAEHHTDFLNSDSIIKYQLSEASV